MDYWQRRYIECQLPLLLENTLCTTRLLSILRSQGILSLFDLKTLHAIGSSRGNLEMTNHLYDVLFTRNEAYDVTVKALHEDNQTGARNILFFGYLQHGIYPPFDFADDVFDWNSEYVSFPDLILSRCAIVQDRMILLGDFCKDIGPTKLKEIMQKTIDNDAVRKLIRNEYYMTANTIPDIPNYYVPRTLTGRFRLRADVLNGNSNDIFLVKGLTLSQLTKWVYPHIADRSSNQLLRTSIRHIMCELDEDFYKICENSQDGSSIHLLEYENGIFKWIRSHGHIATIQNHVHEEQNSLTDSALVKQLMSDPFRQRPVCISDSPGMGKTVLLAKIASEINGSGENPLVLFFLLREFMQLTPTKVKDITLAKIHDVMASQIARSEFAKAVVLEYLTSEEKRVDIFLDGFDELLDKQIKPARHLLKILTSKFSNNRVHVSTRPHMLKELEETLGVLGYNILPFQDADQADLLVNFWNLNINIPTHAVPQPLIEFARLCLKTLKETVKDDENEIVGVPLHCRLLGEIYQPQAERVLNDVHPNKEVLVASCFQMYNQFMRMRFGQVRNQQTLLDRAPYGAGKLNSHMTMEEVRNIHFVEAIGMLFPEFTYTAKTILSIDHKKYFGCYQIFDVGLIVPTSNLSQSYRFFHKSHAEYLVAEFVVDFVTSTKPANKNSKLWNLLADFLFNTLLQSRTITEPVLRHELHSTKSKLSISRFENSVIAYFINGYLGHRNWRPGGHSGAYLSNINTYPNVYRRAAVEALLACSVANFKHIFGFIINIFPEKYFIDFLLSENFSIAVAKYSDFDINTTFHDLVSGTIKQSVKNNVDAHYLANCVQVAVQRGNYQVVALLLSTYKDLCISDNLLHVCLIESIFDKADKVKQKLEIIDLLLQYAPHLLDQELEHDNSTPILQQNVHLELMECLLDKGANVNATTTSNENVLHKFLKRDERHSIEEFDLLEFLDLIIKFNFHGFNNMNSNEDIPLSLALRRVGVGDRTFSILKRETNLQFKNSNGENLLYIAIINQHSIGYIRQLHDYGVDIKAVTNQLTSLIHIAVAIQHVNAVEYLIHEYNCLVNAADANGNTPLHFAVTNQTESSVLIQNMLLDAGADLFVANSAGYTPVEYLLETSVDLSLTLQQVRLVERLNVKMPRSHANIVLHAFLMNKSVVELINQNECLELIGHLIRNDREAGSNRHIFIPLTGMTHCLEQITGRLIATYFSKHEELTDPFKILKIIKEQHLKENDKQMLSLLELNENSMEFVIFVLICLKDVESLRSLITAYQSIQSDYKTSPLFLVGRQFPFCKRFGQKFIIIYSDCFPLTVAKIQSEIYPCIPVIDLHSFNQIWTALDTDVIILTSDFDISSFLNVYETYTCKHTCIIIHKCSTNTNSNLMIADDAQVVKDYYDWHTLSTGLKDTLLLRHTRYYNLGENKDKHGVQKLDLHDVLNSDAVPVNLIIPRYVQALYNQMFDGDDISNPSSYLEELQILAFNGLFPNVKLKAKRRIVSSDEMSNISKQLIWHGPTASYLAAIWIFRNLGELGENCTINLTDIFGYTPLKLEIYNPLNSKTISVPTYEFKNWLVMYFLDRLALKWPVSDHITAGEGEANKMLHCCINLHGHNLIRLFKDVRSLDAKTLHVAAKRGNLSLFVHALRSNRDIQIHA